MTRPSPEYDFTPTDSEENLDKVVGSNLSGHYRNQSRQEAVPDGGRVEAADNQITESSVELVRSVWSEDVYEPDARNHQTNQYGEEIPENAMTARDFRVMLERNFENSYTQGPETTETPVQGVGINELLEDTSAGKAQELLDRAAEDLAELETEEYKVCLEGSAYHEVTFYEMETQ